MKKVFCIMLATLCVSQFFGQDKKKVAVYIVCKDAGMSKVIGGKMVGAITKSSSYVAIERTEDFLNELHKEQSYQRAGNVDNTQISKLGKQFGVDLVCVAEITEVLGSNYLSARMIDVESASVLTTADGHNEMKNLNELIATAENVASKLTGSSGNIIVEFKSTAQSSKNYIELPDYGLMVQKKDLGSGHHWSTANEMCKMSKLGGFNDWRLPTKAELAILYNERDVIGGFTTNKNNPFYWSSTVYSGNHYWVQGFNNGVQGFNNGVQTVGHNSHENHCRCVRSY